MHLRKAPSVQTTLYERTVIQLLADVREVFEDQYGILELVGVGDDCRRDCVEYIVTLPPQCLSVGLGDAFAPAFLKASGRREIRLTELPNQYPLPLSFYL